MPMSNNGKMLLLMNSSILPHLKGNVIQYSAATQLSNTLRLATQLKLAKNLTASSTPHKSKSSFSTRLFTSVNEVRRTTSRTCKIEPPTILSLSTPQPIKNLVSKRSEPASPQILQEMPCTLADFGSNQTGYAVNLDCR